MTEILKNITESESRSIHEVRKFVSRVWEHPLVTEKTRQHRINSMRVIREFMTSGGVKSEEYFTMPFGSSLWIPNEESDYDIYVVCRTSAAWTRVTSLISDSKSRKNLRMDVLPDLFLNIDRDSLLSSGYCKYYSLGSLMITPDQYIEGNVQMAQELRVETIEAINNDSEGIQQYYWKEDRSLLTRYFSKWYKDWENHGGSRKARFTQGLEARSKQSHNPERWKIKFLDAREKLKIPQFSTYREAILATKGQLNILPPYIAQGIK